MADFINFEAEIDAESDFSDGDEIIDDNASDFINDDNEINESRDFYRQFVNVENDLEQVLADAQNEAPQDIEQFDEISNLNDEMNVKWKLMIFKSRKIALKNFKKRCFQKMKKKVKISYVMLYFLA